MSLQRQRKRLFTPWVDKFQLYDSGYNLLNSVLKISAAEFKISELLTLQIIFKTIIVHLARPTVKIKIKNTT